MAADCDGLQNPLVQTCTNPACPDWEWAAFGTCETAIPISPFGLRTRTASCIDQTNSNTLDNESCGDVPYVIASEECDVSCDTDCTNGETVTELCPCVPGFF